jgi:COP9 signalosome complex subunit 3
MSCGHFADAEPILECPITAFPPKKASEVDAPWPCARHAVASGYITEESGFTDEVGLALVQEYFLQAGMAYIGLRKWDEAQLMLEHVLVTPTQGPASGLMLEAYQKWVIVSCLAQGRVSYRQSSILL